MRIKRIIYSLLAAFVAFCFSSCFLKDIYESITDMYKIHSTTDIAEYGDFPTTEYGYEIKPYTDNIMPPKIEDFFADPVYYFGYCNAPYMHEVYLEVTIEDEETYTAYVQGLLEGKETETFFYNDEYQEYVLTDILYLADKDSLSKSEVQKILFSDKQNKIIFISLLILHMDMTFNLEYFIYFEKLGITDVPNYYNGARIWEYEKNELPFLYR